MFNRISLVAVLALSSACLAQNKVRSTLYPENWQPGYQTASGDYLHDFSYAGYHKSEIPLPRIDKNIVDVTKDPYRADATAAADATAVIQRAIDAVGSAGGGVVYLPAGTYKVSFQANRDFALRVHHSNVVLRGAGISATRIYCDDLNARQKNVVLAQPDNPPWWPDDKSPALATQDLLMPTRTIPLESANQFAKGDLVVVRTSMTEELVAEMKMAGKWDPKKFRGMTLLRRIAAVDTAAKTVTLDAPTRYPMKMRDGARIYKLRDTNLREVGFEDFSVGMRQNPGTTLADDDYDKKDTAAYQLHGSYAVNFSQVEDGWITRVGSFRPEGNAVFHLQSNGLRLNFTRQVTVAECDFRHPQYLGGGGNGYMFSVNGNENLFRDCIGVFGRHNYSLGLMSCIGNVFYNCTLRDGRLASDFHMWFSSANLLDNMVVERDFLECVFRPWGGNPMHGEPGSHNVFWNTRGLAYKPKFKFVVLSRQVDKGYVIGTQGPASAVAPQSTNVVELVGQGDKLEPQSLWQDQLKRRMRATANATVTSFDHP